MDIRTERVVDLEHQQISRLLQLTLGKGNGMMYDALLYFLVHNTESARATIAYNDSNILVGWTLGFRNYERIWELYTFVDEAYRSEGIGTRLIAHAGRGRKGAIAIHAHTGQATALYIQGMRRGRYIDRSGDKGWGIAASSRKGWLTEQCSLHYQLRATLH